MYNFSSFKASKTTLHKLETEEKKQNSYGQLRAHGHAV